ncbi:MAG TPA: cytochrome c, partial [Phototrophicaceae bacterium]|nr:cytochrome c [Phototrophicaceae bacterium]
MSQNNSSPQTHSETNSYAAVISGVVVMLAFGVLLMGSLSNRTHVPYTPPAEVSVQPTPTLMTQLPKLNVITYNAIDVASGASQFGAVCSGCHASDARGIPGLGKNLVESEFVSDLKDDELFQFITVGRPAYDAANTTGVDMPARGGNPALTDQNLHQIIAYIRTLKDPSLISEPGSEVAALPEATRTPVPLVGTSQPFTPLDLSSLSVGAGSSGAGSQTQVPLPTIVEATSTPEPSLVPTEAASTEVAAIATETGS